MRRSSTSLPEPRLGEVLPYALNLHESFGGWCGRHGRSRLRRHRAHCSVHHSLGHDASLCQEAHQAIPESRLPLEVEPLAGRNVGVAQHEHTGVRKDLGGPLGLNRRVDVHVVQLSLRLHVESLEFGEHLLQIEPILGKNEYGPVHRRQTNHCAAFGLDMYFDVVARPGLSPY